jgi:hypothetical protein
MFLHASNPIVSIHKGTSHQPLLLEADFFLLAPKLFIQLRMANVPLGNVSLIVAQLWHFRLHLP